MGYHDEVQGFLRLLKNTGEWDRGHVWIAYTPLSLTFLKLLATHINHAVASGEFQLKHLTLNHTELGFVPWHLSQIIDSAYKTLELKLMKREKLSKKLGPLLELIRHSPELESLDLSDNYFTANQMKALFESLQDASSLLSLNLSGNSLTPENCRLLNSLLKRIPIKILKLNHCGLTTDAVRALFTGSLSHLSHLELSNNTFEANGLKHIRDWKIKYFAQRIIHFESPNLPTVVCDEHNTEIRDSAEIKGKLKNMLQNSCEVLRAAKSVLKKPLGWALKLNQFRLLLGASPFVSSESLDPVWNEVFSKYEDQIPEEVTQHFEALQSDESSNVLKIRIMNFDLPIDHEGQTLLQHLIKKGPEYEEAVTVLLNHGANPLAGNKLAMNQLTLDKFIDFYNSVSDSSSIITLNLKGTGLTKKHLAQIYSHRAFKKVVHLDLSGNDLGNEFAPIWPLWSSGEYIAGWIKHNEQFKTIRLANNQFQDWEIKKIAKRAQNHSSLQAIDVSDNLSLSDEAYEVALKSQTEWFWGNNIFMDADVLRQPIPATLERFWPSGGTQNNTETKNVESETESTAPSEIALPLQNKTLSTRAISAEPSLYELFDRFASETIQMTTQTLEELGQSLSKVDASHHLLISLRNLRDNVHARLVELYQYPEDGESSIDLENYLIAEFKHFLRDIESQYGNPFQQDNVMANDPQLKKALNLIKDPVDYLKSQGSGSSEWPETNRNEQKQNWLGAFQIQLFAGLMSEWENYWTPTEDAQKRHKQLETIFTLIKGLVGVAVIGSAIPILVATGLGPIIPAASNAAFAAINEVCEWIEKIAKYVMEIAHASEAKALSVALVTTWVSSIRNRKKQEKVKAQIKTRFANPLECELWCKRWVLKVTHHYQDQLKQLKKEDLDKVREWLLKVMLTMWGQGVPGKGERNNLDSVWLKFIFWNAFPDTLEGNNFEPPQIAYGNQSIPTNQLFSKPGIRLFWNSNDEQKAQAVDFNVVYVNQKNPKAKQTLRTQWQDYGTRYATKAEKEIICDALHLWRTQGTAQLGDCKFKTDLVDGQGTMIISYKSLNANQGYLGELRPEVAPELTRGLGWYKNELKNKINELQTNYKKIQERVNGIEGEIQQLKTEIGEIKRHQNHMTI